MSQIKALLAAYWTLLVPAALVVALIMSSNARRIAKLAMRGFSRPILLLAVIALVYDGTRSLSTPDHGVVITSLGEHWSTLAPNSYQNTHTLVRRRVYPALWDSGIAPVLRLPSWFVFGLVGFGLAWAGRRRQEISVFAN